MECNLAAMGNGCYLHGESMNNFCGFHVDEHNKERMVFSNQSTSKEALLLSVLLFHTPEGLEQLKFRGAIIQIILKRTRRDRILPVRSHVFTQSGNPLMVFLWPLMKRSKCASYLQTIRTTF
jgi:hypothetical protein